MYTAEHTRIKPDLHKLEKLVRKTPSQLINFKRCKYLPEPKWTFVLLMVLDHTISLSAPTCLLQYRWILANLETAEHVFYYFVFREKFTSVSTVSCKLLLVEGGTWCCTLVHFELVLPSGVPSTTPRSFETGFVSLSGIEQHAFPSFYASIW